MSLQLIPSRPVTIHAMRDGQVWFPFMFRLSDDSLMMVCQIGHDAKFAPCKRWRSRDEGKTWLQEPENVPRLAHAFSFEDGTLFEIDIYGFFDPETSDTFCYYGAWSKPGSINSQTEKNWVRVAAPSLAPLPLTENNGQNADPHFPWWEVMNATNGRDDLPASEILMGGPYFTDMALYQGRLLATGYHTARQDEEVSGLRMSTFCYESWDRGHSWQEIGTVARANCIDPFPGFEGFNESTLTLLRDGRLLSIVRSGDALYQCWSSDGGKSWSELQPTRVENSVLQPRRVWPRCAQLDDGTLVLSYGRPGKHLIFDPTGTGQHWQGHLDLHEWELKTQELMGVPAEQRLRGDTGDACIRYWDSGDYLSVTPTGPREFLVTYDVQNFVEHWNALPIFGVRMVRVCLEDQREL